MGRLEGNRCLIYAWCALPCLSPHLWLYGKACYRDWIVIESVGVEWLYKRCDVGRCRNWRPGSTKGCAGTAARKTGGSVPKKNLTINNLMFVLVMKACSHTHVCS